MKSVDINYESLTEAQRGLVAGWHRDGLTPTVIQGKLVELFGLRLTHMDVRMLLADLEG